jgi:hypothetical protein
MWRPAASNLQLMTDRFSSNRWLLTASFVLLLVAGRWSLVAEVEAAHLEEIDGVRVVYLSGTPFEIGRQHGTLLREEVRSSVGRVLGYFRHYLKIPGLRSWLVSWWLDSAWRQAAPYIPPDDLEELRGLSEGSGVRLRELFRLHAIPDRTYACANFAAWGRATQGGRLIHLRNLDWNIDAGIQQFATVFVIRPTGKRAFVSVGWAGFVGVLTGINEAQLSVGQVGAETVEARFDGEPMTFLIRRVLEESGGIDEAAALVTNARRTVGVNYIIADARARRAIAIETTHRLARVFEADDPAEREIAYARPVADAVLRADTAIDPSIRARQIASGGNPATPVLEPPTGSAYEKRYLGQASGIMAHYGALTAETAKEIARAVAPDSNIQSVIFAWPDLWVANAQGTTPAAQTIYHHLDLERLFRDPGVTRR